jgi:hypothetical protein
MYSVQHYVIKFVSGLRQVGGFSTNETDCHDITEILLKVALKTVSLAYMFLHPCVVRNVYANLTKNIIDITI